jgi:transposase
MSKAISSEKRRSIVKHMQAGESKKEISKWLEVCVRTVTRVWNKYQSTGNYEANPPNSGRKPLVSVITMNHIISYIGEHSDVTLRELIEIFSLPISESALCRRLINLGMRYKKKRSTPLGKNVKM